MRIGRKHCLLGVALMHPAPIYGRMKGGFLILNVTYDALGATALNSERPSSDTPTAFWAFFVIRDER